MELKTWDIQPQELMVSFDVCSLFTKVPTNEAIEVICEKLNDDPTLGERTNLSIDFIKRLMNTCMQSSYLVWQGQIYKQMEGAPMGLSLSVVMANAYMEHFEKVAIQTAHLKPRIWRRFVDDTYVIWPHGRDTLPAFLQHLNNISPSIKFTMEIEEDNQIPFLDILISRHNGKLTTTVYRKPTHTNVYLRQNSHHPDNIKLGVIKCLYERADKLCDNTKVQQEKQYLNKVFKSNGYSETFIKQATRPKRQIQQAETNTDHSFISIPYIRGLSEPIARILKKHNIKTAFRARPTLKNILVHLKDPITQQNQRGSIYMITCACGKKYIGETGRPLSVRMEEHKRAWRLGHHTKSAIAEHSLTCEGPIEWNSVKILGIERHFYKRKIRESLEICKHKTNPGFGLNRDQGTDIGTPWVNLIKATPPQEGPTVISTSEPDSPVHSNSHH